MTFKQNCCLQRISLLIVTHCFTAEFLIPCSKWFTAHPRMVSLFLPPYSPFLNFIEEFFSSWRWRVYDHQPHDQMSPLDIFPRCIVHKVMLRRTCGQKIRRQDWLALLSFYICSSTPHVCVEQVDLYCITGITLVCFCAFGMTPYNQFNKEVAIFLL